MRNFWNWFLIGVGGILIILELVLGAATGFDFALIGLSLACGGAVGLWFGSTKAGMLSAGALALLYVAFIRRRLRARLTPKEVRPSNVDRLPGQSGVVTQRVAAQTAGRVKLGDEEWRAVLAADAGEAREAGQVVKVESVEGVTLTVR